MTLGVSRFSAALCRGLIEAARSVSPGMDGWSGFSAALCRGLIEAAYPLSTPAREWPGFPRLYAAASLKPRRIRVAVHRQPGFPRLYAAASLKRHERGDEIHLAPRFSAALCRGLIEASGPTCSSCRCASSFPRLYAAASLKLPAPRPRHGGQADVFRGFMPRPH